MFDLPADATVEGFLLDNPLRDGTPTISFHVESKAAFSDVPNGQYPPYLGPRP